MTSRLRFLPTTLCRVGRKKHKLVLLLPQERKQLKFQTPATLPKRQKLYVVSSKGEVLYVGRTSRPMADRIRLGLRPGKRRGYHGYKWRRPAGRLLTLHVCMTGRSKYMTEAIEAEVVRIVRCTTGKWPQGQTEIHFHNRSGAAQQAAELYAKIMKQ